MKAINYDKNRIIKQHNKYKHVWNTVGLLPICAMYLRFDILHKYVNPNERPVQAHITLLLLIMPNMLPNIMKIINKCMLGACNNCNDKCNHDLINNPSFDPINRLKFLWYLAFSYQFGKALMKNAWYFNEKTIGIYNDLRKEINLQYYNFDYFIKQWNLLKYKRFGNNGELQKEFYNNFKIIIQSIFGLTCFYLNYECLSQQTPELITN